MNTSLKTGDRFSIKLKNDVLNLHFVKTHGWSASKNRQFDLSVQGYRDWVASLDIGIEVDSHVFTSDGMVTSTYYKVVDGPKYMIYLLRAKVRDQMLVW